MVSGNRYRRSPGERRPSGRPVELELTGGAYGGRMIAREGESGRVVFVAGGMPGETVRAELTLEKPRYAEARAVGLVGNPAEGREAPPCVYFGENGHNRGPVPSGGGLPGPRGACGGCQYQHLDYNAQLALKRGIVADLLARQARLPDLEVRETVPSPTPWRYRNRARWIVDEEGRPCYHQAASERLIAVDHCHIVQPLIEDVLARLSEEEWRPGLRDLVAEVTARTATPWEEPETGKTLGPTLLLALHPRPGAKRRDLKLFAGDLVDGIPAVDGVVMAPHAEGPGGSLWGYSYFDAFFAGQRYHLSPLTFWQVNEPAAELLVAQVLDLLGDLGGQSVLDVYAGAGTFTLPIAARAAQVVALENDPMAVDDANRSARASGLGNVHLLPGDAAEELSGLPRRAADAAVLDPPRAGLHERVVAELARIEVPRIVYVSCDPSTLARDLRRFVDLGYRVEGAQPVDLFPQTYHVETVTVLTRR